MFQQTDAYLNPDQLTLSPSFKPPTLTVTNDGVYRFFWAHADPKAVTDGYGSQYCEFVANTNPQALVSSYGAQYSTLSTTTQLNPVSLSASGGNTHVAAITITSYMEAQQGSRGMGSGYAILDGTSNYVEYSQTSGVLNSAYVSSVWCIGKVAASAGAKITSLVLLAATDGTNYLKKCRTVTLYYSPTGVAGSFTLVQSWTSSYPVLNGSPAETMTLTTPLALAGIGSDYIQVVIAGNWGDPYGYMWCSEVQVIVQS